MTSAKSRRIRGYRVLQHMICHQYKCVYVHIPKTGGQSIERVFMDLLGLTWETRAPLLLRINDRPEVGPPRLAHLKAEQYVRFNYLSQEAFDDYFKFAFVRNPWGRMVSIYKFMGFDKKIDFKPFLLGMFKKYIFEQQNWFVGPQSDFVYSREGELLVDFLGRFEDLEHGFDYVCEQIGIPATILPHINQSGSRRSVFETANEQSDGSPVALPEIWKPIAHQNYQDYYDQDTLDCVSQLYRSDIKLFGYQFN